MPDASQSSENIGRDVQSLIDTIFGPPSVYRYPVAADDLSPEATAVRAVSPTIVAMLKGNTIGPFLVPFGRQGDAVTTWYAWTTDAGSARAMSHELGAFLGPSYLNVRGRASGGSADDGIERALESTLGGRVTRFCAARPQDEAAVVNQLGLYLNLLKRRPAAERHVPLTFGQIRAKFDNALLVRDESAARAYIAALRDRRMLNAENYQYLEIRLAAAMERWEDITGNRLLRALTQLRLPPETYGDIVEALYTVHLRDTEGQGTLDELVSDFESRVFQFVPELFRTRRTSRRPAVMKSFLLLELFQSRPDAAICFDLFGALPVDAFGPKLSIDVSARIQAIRIPSDEAVAALAYQREEFDRAFALYSKLPPTFETLCRLLRCAREIDDPQRSGEARRIVDGVPEALRRQVRDATPRMWRLVDARAAESIALSRFTTWASRFDWNDGGVETAAAYVERMREGALAWEPRQLLAESGLAQIAADILERLAVDSSDVFEQVYPLWYELFVNRLTPSDSRAVPVYQALVSTLRMRDMFGDDELVLIEGAVVSMLACSIGKVAYRALVDDLTKMLTELRSPRLVDWGLDICDALAAFACPDPEVRLRFVTGVMQLVRESARRLSRVQLGFANLLATEAGLEPYLPAASLEAVDGQVQQVLPERIGVYTLDSEAGRRAKELLATLYPGLRVDVRSDEVCTKQLQQLARAVSLFIFAWKSSKHQAFWCVKKAMNPNGRLCMAKGAGTTSLIYAFEEQLRDAEARQVPNE